MTVEYLDAAGSVKPGMISSDFFVGWPTAPSLQQLVDVMDGSYRRIWALEDGSVVGFVNAISDGVLNASIPWLEVHPAWQGQGIGTELLRRIVQQLDGMYAIDLSCDPDMVSFYVDRGFLPLAGGGLRSPLVLKADGDATKERG